MRGWLHRNFGGHCTFTVPFLRWRVTIYGFNAMHVAINVRTIRWGYICFHPPMRCFGAWWPWYFYVSKNATPWAAYRAIGPGVANDDKEAARTRRKENRCTCRGTRVSGQACDQCGYNVR